MNQHQHHQAWLALHPPDKDWLHPHMGSMRRSPASESRMLQGKVCFTSGSIDLEVCVLL